jgi:selenocysteine lyase/cysteine desulfurase
MRPDRRTFLAAAAAAPLMAASNEPDWSAIRKEFPWAEKQIFLNPAGWHPMRRKAIEAMQKYLEFRLNGPINGKNENALDYQGNAKRLFAQLINAAPSEISFAQSTQFGENITVVALGIPGSQWNVVTDELHYEGSLHLYQSLQKQGLDLRIVKMKDLRIDPNDVDKAVNKNTRLVATSLVSCANGGLVNAKAFADIAHANGAYLYTDVIQAAGAVPIDVKALGIDFCACSGYKFLMGDRGLGFLYVRGSLLGTKAKRFQFGDRQFANFQYHIFPNDPPGPRPASWEMRKGAAAYFEVGNCATGVAAGHVENLRFILDLGVNRIQAHAKPMVDRLRKEVPKLGYPLLTPTDTPTPTTSFVVADQAKLTAKMKKANIDVKQQWNQMRVSVSVYHNMADIDRFLDALGS